MNVSSTVPTSFHVTPGRRLACVVCGQILSATALASPQEPYPSCHQVQCRMIVARREAMGDVLFRPWLAQQAQQHRHLQAQNKLIAERVAREGEENRQALASLQEQHGGAQDGTLHSDMQAILPSGPRVQQRIKRTRRKRYRLHLARVIEQAFAEPGGPTSMPGIGVVPESAPGGSALPGQLCAMCGGGCCTQGSDHAYLSAATIRRWLRERPELTAEAILDAYVSRVPRHSALGSCINHGPQGCVLPREMRSDICNVYACDALTLLESAIASEQPIQRVFVVQRTLDNWASKTQGNAKNPLRRTGLLQDKTVNQG